MRKNVVRHGGGARRPCSGTWRSSSSLTDERAAAHPLPPLPRQTGTHARLCAAQAGRDHPRDADRRGARLPHAAPDPVRSRRHHRRRQRQLRAGCRDPQAPGPRPADPHAVRHLDRQDAAGRPRRVLLLQEAGDRADPRSAGADGVAGGAHDPAGRADRRPARRARRLSARRLARPHRHGLLGAGLLGAGVRHRLPADLRVRHRAQLAARAGLPAPRARASADGCSGSSCPRSRCPWSSSRSSPASPAPACSRS